jgi:cytochrome c biogenesis protein CcmG, thiol:disulfide interchange protein DsbE
MRPERGAGSRARLLGRAWRLGGGLLVVALCSPASADEPAVASLLKSVNLVAYRPGTLPPPFGGSTLDGQPLALTELRGKVVILNFWASWCLECRAEMPLLENLHRAYASRGLAIVGVNAREAARRVRRHAEELGLTFPLVLDPGGKINALYGVIGVPTSFVVGRDGRAVAFGVGPHEWGNAPVRALLEALLAEPASRAGAP